MVEHAMLSRAVSCSTSSSERDGAKTAAIEAECEALAAKRDALQTECKAFARVAAQREMDRAAASATPPMTPAPRPADFARRSDFNEAEAAAARERAVGEREHVVAKREAAVGTREAAVAAREASLALKASAYHG